MKNVDILVGEQVLIRARRKKFLVGSPDIYIIRKGKAIDFYYNIDEIPIDFQDKLIGSTKYIGAEGNFFSKEMTHPITGKDSYSIQIPKNYRFRIRNK